MAIVDELRMLRTALSSAEQRIGELEHEAIRRGTEHVMTASRAEKGWQRVKELEERLATAEQRIGELEARNADLEAGRTEIEGEMLRTFENYRVDLQSVTDRLATAERERDEAQVDADRYRWLKSRLFWLTEAQDPRLFCLPPIPTLNGNLDDAIDAYKKAQP